MTPPETGAAHGASALGRRAIPDAPASPRATSTRSARKRAAPTSSGAHQTLRHRRVPVTNGAARGRDHRGRRAGIGLQLFARDGRSAFASPRPRRRRTARGRAPPRAPGARSREASRREHAANPEVWAPRRHERRPSLPGAGLRVRPPQPLRQLERELVALNRGIAAAAPGLKVETAFTIRDEEWVVTALGRDAARASACRARPPCNQITLGRARRRALGDGRREHAVLRDPARRRRGGSSSRASRRAVARLERLRDAPHVPAGSYPLVIDYALAKGLAHEAFGHASESDSYGSSCLAEEGKLRRRPRGGDPVALDHRRAASTATTPTSR